MIVANYTELPGIWLLGIASCSVQILLGQLVNPRLVFRCGEKTSAVFAGDPAILQI